MNIYDKIIKCFDAKVNDAVRFSIRKYEHHYREFGYAIYDNKVKRFLATDKKIVYFDTKEEAKKWLTNMLNKNGMKNVI